MENRAFREMQSLVHDLKTPLTSIQGLAGVIAISQEHGEIKKHASYISSLVDKMSIMIDELLKDDSRQVIPVNELVEYSLAHVPALAKLSKFEFVTMDGLYVRVNKIKVARAIINVLENAMAAVDLEQGRIGITVEQKGAFVAVTIVDNGQGFIGDFEENVWKAGYSVKNSSGLGLPFVRAIIEKHSGFVEISNNSSGGAKVVMLLPEVKEYE
jgi:signal transduction histidine kinase